LTAAAASVSEPLSILTTMSLLPGPLGRSDRAVEAVLEGSRTQAMVVVEGRER